MKSFEPYLKEAIYNYIEDQEMAYRSTDDSKAEELELQELIQHMKELVPEDILTPELEEAIKKYENCILSVNVHREERVLNALIKIFVDKAVL